jgi:hypothetical protein
MPIPAPLALTEKIASGKHRVCWRHPQDPSLCIKVAIPGSGKNDNANEHHYLRHLASRGVQSRHLPRTYGWAETDHGRGLVTDLIQTPAGTPAPDLRFALRNGLMEEAKAQQLVSEALDWAADQGVIVLDARPQNFVIGGSKSTGEWLVFIDGLGTYTLAALPYRLACIFPPYEYWRARQKIKVRRKVMQQKIRDLAAEKTPRPPPHQ